MLGRYRATTTSGRDHRRRRDAGGQVSTAARPLLGPIACIWPISVCHRPSAISISLSHSKETPCALHRHRVRSAATGPASTG
jgi:hypothetical protein